ncbi:periplasmic binding protein-like I [Obelidium mucronatum]|nr:periplasmic binding protein-like I [Obelidium mucronatum]
MMAYAVETVNNSTEILPGITVNIKRFSGRKKRCSADLGYFGDSGGLASSLMALDIIERNTDVVGVVGAQYSTTAKGPAEILSNNMIPYCSSTCGAPLTIPAYNGFGDQFNVLLKEWNIRQVGLVYSNTELGRGAASSFLDSMDRNNIAVVSQLQLNSYYSTNDLNYALFQLELTNARYVVVFGNGIFTGQFIQKFRAAGMMDSGERVLFISATPSIAFTSEDSADLLSGVIILQPKGNGDTPAGRRRTELLQQRYPDMPVTQMGLPMAFDCVLMMLMGFHRLVMKSGIDGEQLPSRKDMNFTLFQNLGYAGLYNDPMELDEFGDLKLGYIAYYYTGNYLNSTAFGEIDLNATRFTPLNDVKAVFFNGSTSPPWDGKTILQEFKPSETSKAIVYIFSLLGLFLCILSCWAISGTLPRKTRRGVLWQTYYIILGCALGYVYIILIRVEPSSRAICLLREGVLVSSFAIVFSNAIFKHALIAYIASRKVKLKNSREIVLFFWTMCAAAIVLEMVIFAFYAWKVKISIQATSADTGAFYFKQCVHMAPIPTTSLLLIAYNILLYVGLLITIFLQSRIPSIELNESSNLSIMAAIIPISYFISDSLSEHSKDPYLDFKVAICVFIAVTTTLFVTVGKKLLEVLAASIKNLQKKRIEGSRGFGSIPVRICVPRVMYQMKRANSWLHTEWRGGVCELNTCGPKTWLSFAGIQTDDVFVLSEMRVHLKQDTSVALSNKVCWIFVEFDSQQERTAFIDQLKPHC